MRIITLITFLTLSAALIAATPSTKFSYHTVAKGETLYSISRQYGIKPAELASYNDAVGDKFTIKIGQKLKVPSSGAEVSDASPVSSTVNAGAKLANSGNYHIVKKGDTFYSIARQYNVARTDLQMWNELDEFGLKIGQKLLIRKEDGAKETSHPATAKSNTDQSARKDVYAVTLAKGQTSNVSTSSGDVTASSSAVGLASTRTIKSWKEASAADRAEENKPIKTYDPSPEYESLYYQNVYSGLSKKSETGVAKLVPETSTASHVAYYNNASVGTILKLTNPDNGKTAYAIVVGKLPTAENNSYLVKLSEKVARNLSVKDYASVEVICYTGN